MIAALVSLMALFVVVLVVVMLISQPVGIARQNEVVYMNDSRWDPWGSWPVGPWSPQWNPHPFHPQPHRKQHMLGPGGERRLMGAAHRA
jgi:hypothetical protein